MKISIIFSRCTVLQKKAAANSILKECRGYSTIADGPVGKNKMLPTIFKLLHM